MSDVCDVRIYGNDDINSGIQIRSVLSVCLQAFLNYKKTQIDQNMLSSINLICTLF